PSQKHKRTLRPRKPEPWRSRHAPTLMTCAALSRGEGQSRKLGGPRGTLPTFAVSPPAHSPGKILPPFGRRRLLRSSPWAWGSDGFWLRGSSLTASRSPTAGRTSGSPSVGGSRRQATCARYGLSRSPLGGRLDG